jgi:hypothetical protein
LDPYCDRKPQRRFSTQNRRGNISPIDPEWRQSPSQDVNQGSSWARHLPSFERTATGCRLSNKEAAPVAERSRGIGGNAISNRGDPGSYLARNVIIPCVISYGLTETFTLSPGNTRMWFLLMRPESCARISVEVLPSVVLTMYWPPPMASCTTPAISIWSSLGI